MWHWAVLRRDLSQETQPTWLIQLQEVSEGGLWCEHWPSATTSCPFRLEPGQRGDVEEKWENMGASALPLSDLSSSYRF